MTHQFWCGLLISLRQHGMRWTSESFSPSLPPSESFKFPPSRCAPSGPLSLRLSLSSPARGPPPSPPRRGRTIPSIPSISRFLRQFFSPSEAPISPTWKRCVYSGCNHCFKSYQVVSNCLSLPHWLSTSPSNPRSPPLQAGSLIPTWNRFLPPSTCTSLHTLACEHDPSRSSSHKGSPFSAARSTLYAYHLPVHPGRPIPTFRSLP